MLRPLPYNDPDRIVTVWDSFPKLGVGKIGVTYANFADFKERNHVFEPLALYTAGSTTGFNLKGLGGPERVQAARATGDFFRALGVAPLHGRTLTQEDEETGRNRIFQALSVMLVGLGVGTLGAPALARVLSDTLSGLLFGVRANGPATFAFVALLLSAVALVACYVPARRAVKVDPTIALRSE
jgi:hypothetical protein